MDKKFGTAIAGSAALLNMVECQGFSITTKNDRPFKGSFRRGRNKWPDEATSLWGWERMRVAGKKTAKKAATRKVNCKRQRWTEERAGLTLRLPLDLREAITEESRVKGDLAKIVLYALSHVEHDEVEIQQTRKAGMELTNPQLLHVGAEARALLKEWAEVEGSSVNAIVVSVLDEYFKRLKKSSALRKELRQEFRSHRGFLKS
jgi:hypothetical protein